MFKNNGRYRHRNCLDIDLIVCGAVFKVLNGDYLFDAMYWNRKYDCPAYPGTEAVKIKKEHLYNWSIVKENFV